MSSLFDKSAAARLHKDKTMENRLKELRRERNWSQAELAARLAVSRQTVNSLERGKYDPSLPLAFRIARVFGLTIETIFTPETGEAE